MNDDSSSRKKRIQGGVGLVLVGAVLAGSALAFSGKSNTNNSTMVSRTSTQSVASANVNYKNGVYSATGNYDSPGGEEHLKVTVTLSGDVITGTSATSGANDSTAQTYEDIFISGYKSQVVGKKLNAIQINNIAGSSLTTKGFNDAIKQIEDQAKA